MKVGHPELEIADQAVTALRGRLGKRLIAVVLFGSRALGRASTASDWDMLVIAEKLPEKAFQRHVFLRRFLPPGCSEAVSLLARTPEEFESHLPSLYLDIAVDGQILYDSSGYAAKKLAELRDLIDRMGLYREQTEGGDIWRWRSEPTGAWALDWGRQECR